LTFLSLIIQKQGRYISRFNQNIIIYVRDRCSLAQFIWESIAVCIHRYRLVDINCYSKDKHDYDIATSPSAYISYTRSTIIIFHGGTDHSGHLHTRLDVRRVSHHFHFPSLSFILCTF